MDSFLFFLLIFSGNPFGWTAGPDSTENRRKNRNPSVYSLFPDGWILFFVGYFLGGPARRAGKKGPAGKRPTKTGEEKTDIFLPPFSGGPFALGSARPPGK
jgi:hypothetical protein